LHRSNKRNEHLGGKFFFVGTFYPPEADERALYHRPPNGRSRAHINAVSCHPIKFVPDLKAMTSRISVQIDFSYQGETYHPRMELDLDVLMDVHGTLPDLYPMLASQHHIDTYSYLYEVMCAHEITYSDAQGLAADFLQQDEFDQHGFEQAWRQQRLLQQLAELAQSQMQIDDLSQHPPLQQALLAAYKLGRQAAQDPRHDP
jgi:hypothetical protein